MGRCLGAVVPHASPSPLETTMQIPKIPKRVAFTFGRYTAYALAGLVIGLAFLAGFGTAYALIGASQ